MKALDKYILLITFELLVKRVHFLAFSFSYLESKHGDERVWKCYYYRGPNRWALGFLDFFGGEISSFKNTNGSRNLRASVLLLTTAGSQSEMRTVDFAVKLSSTAEHNASIMCSYITLLEKQKKQRYIGHFTVSSLQSDR